MVILDNYASPPPCCCCVGNVNMKWPDTGKCRHQLGSHSLSAVSTHWRPAIVCKKIYLEISVKENVLLIYSKKCCKTWKTILFSKLSLKSDLPLSALFKSNIKVKEAARAAPHTILTYFDIGSKQKIMKVLLWFDKTRHVLSFPSCTSSDWTRVAWSLSWTRAPPRSQPPPSCRTSASSPAQHNMFVI